ncbi:exported hypothetical protein [Planktothrix serta PCC 8927]|uniref:Uncharacterized protein n=1 Tax=Planktothrix serta PCC 8927 TaxID=671068 RepID=A0A7Z9BVA1_9CYAN|nr:hypothetical protein [Planktothrix serta]VXD19121.1 exported hypothetical protein [Planktothrix serta PCC 8927]
MSNFIAVLMISAVVGLPQSVNPQHQIIQELDAEQIQSSQSRRALISINSYEMQVANHNSAGEDPSDKAPKPGDGRREN